MPTPQEFVEQWPLYTKASILGFEPPKSITRMCEKCGKETTWSLRAADPVGYQTFAITCDTAGYTCVLCDDLSLLVIYRNSDWKETKSRGSYAHHTTFKIGQVPPQSIDIPNDLEKRLGATATYYKQALICLSQNFGIGAVAYMRRVVEEKTDELIDVVVELAQTYNADPKIVESLVQAKTRVRYEDKLQVASELIPEALRPGSVNPLGQLYTHLSVGVHGKTDDECVAIFDDLRADFEYVFRNLHVQAKERHEFSERVQSRAGKIRA
jgi:hypothetical protein